MSQSALIYTKQRLLYNRSSFRPLAPMPTGELGFLPLDEPPSGDPPAEGGTGVGGRESLAGVCIDATRSKTPGESGRRMGVSEARRDEGTGASSSGAATK